MLGIVLLLATFTGRCVTSNTDAVQVIASHIAEDLSRNKNPDFDTVAVQLIRASVVNGRVRGDKAYDTFANNLIYHYNGDEVVVYSRGIFGVFERFESARVEKGPTRQ